MNQLLLTLFLLLVIVLIQWRALQRSSRSTRWMFYVTIALGGTIWVYSVTYPDAPRPTDWIQRALISLDPLG